MTDELDPGLHALFAEAREEIPEDDFATRTMQRVHTEIQRRWLWRIAGIVALLTGIAALIPFMASPIDLAAAWLDKHADFIVSPTGWAISILVGVFVLYRARVLGR